MKPPRYSNCHQHSHPKHSSLKRALTVFLWCGALTTANPKGREEAQIKTTANQALQVLNHRCCAALTGLIPSIFLALSGRPLSMGQQVHRAMIIG